MTDTRLIERWLPIAALGEESVRERRSMTALPPIYYLHVWWARRPLVASRAAILASLLPADADKEKFLRLLGIHGDPVAARRRIDLANKKGEKLGPNPYGYKRAFQYLPTQAERSWFENQVHFTGLNKAKLLDPTAGGGSIPLEGARLGVASYANDLNPVASLLLLATVDYPAKFGHALIDEFEALSKRFFDKCEPKLSAIFQSKSEDERVIGYIWARTITCPYCEGTVPLSPHWRLGPKGVGIRLQPQSNGENTPDGRVCELELVGSTKEQSEGTIARGDATCPFDDCRRVISGDDIKSQAQKGLMGEQLIGVAIKKKTLTTTSTGRRREKWIRDFRLPEQFEADLENARAILNKRMPHWLAEGNIPTEFIDQISNYDRGHRMYGINIWSDFFSPRQLYSQGVLVETFRELLSEDETEGRLNDIRRAAYVYLSISIDKITNFNCRQTRWGDNLGRIVAKFDRHNYAMVWSYAEMPLAICGDGLSWALNQTKSCIRELLHLFQNNHTAGEDLFDVNIGDEFEHPPVVVTCKSGDSLDHIENETIDLVVIDPPYYDNVMYAELSDFFYVWLKRTAGHVVPQLFRRQLTDKDNEAVANAAKFQGEKGAKALAGRDYQERMASIFAESRRVLRPNGVMTLMFTHKATGAWDALTKGLIEAGFTITASWPINTEAEGSMHIKNKAAANSTIFLVCRPRVGDMQAETDLYWEDVEPLVAKAVRAQVKEFQDAGISGVDLYLASFGPALEEFSRHWPLKRGTPREIPEERRLRRQQVLFEEEWDPYAATPEDALDAARREVKRWRLEQLTHLKANADLDPATAFLVLAWDAFKAPTFSYDEALRLARAVGVDLESDIVGRLAEKKGSDIHLWDSARRAAKGTLGAIDGSRGMIDAIHHAAHMARVRSLSAAEEMLATALVDKDPRFFAALEAVLEVLPVSKAFTGIELEGDAAASGSDFEALYNLSRLAYSDEIDEPEQLKLWQDDDV